MEGEELTQDAASLARAALAYARREMPVFPCEPLGERPLTRDGFWDASVDAGVVGRWWSRWPAANIGVPTGKQSGLLVLDVDPRDGGLRSLEDLEEAFGPLPRTTRGGRVEAENISSAILARPEARCATAPPGSGRGWT